MRPFPATALLVMLLAAVAAAGEERAAPLADAKKKLRELEAQPGAIAAPGVKDGLKSTPVPTFQSPVQSAPLLRELTPEQRQRESKQRGEAQKNWLLKGMKQLEQESKDGEAEEEMETDRIDTSDPAYLVKLYEKQKKATEAKSAEAAKEQRAPSADPLAPFLQGWLAGSPVKDQILPGSVRTQPGGAPGSIAAAPGATPGVPGSGPATLPDFGRVDGAHTKPNPYLTALTAPGPGDLSQPSLPNAPGGGAASTPMPVLTLPAPPVSPPLAAPAATDRKTPPPPLANEQKYFPQLKKF